MVVKKTIANYSNRRQVNIVKEDNLKDVSEVFLYTSEEHNNIKSRIASLKEEVATTKSQLEEANATIQHQEATINEAIAEARSEIQQDFEARLEDVTAKSEASEQDHLKKLKEVEGSINEINKQHSEAINELNNQLIKQRSHYEDILKDKEAIIKQHHSTIQEKDNIIATLEAKAIEVNEVVNQYNEANIEKTKQHNKEVKALSEANMFLANKYNGLRQAIINKSSLSLLFGGRKQLLIDYQEVKPSDKEAIEIEAPTQSDT